MRHNDHPWQPTPPPCEQPHSYNQPPYLEERHSRAASGQQRKSRGSAAPGMASASPRRIGATAAAPQAQHRTARRSVPTPHSLRRRRARPLRAVRQSHCLGCRAARMWPGCDKRLLGTPWRAQGLPRNRCLLTSESAWHGPWAPLIQLSWRQHPPHPLLGTRSLRRPPAHPSPADCLSTPRFPPSPPRAAL